jgi:hypothetical protein
MARTTLAGMRRCPRKPFVAMCDFRNDSDARCTRGNAEDRNVLTSAAIVLDDAVAPAGEQLGFNSLGASVSGPSTA